jgi:hypothetical protein
MPAPTIDAPEHRTSASKPRPTQVKVAQHDDMKTARDLGRDYDRVKAEREAGEKTGSIKKHGKRTSGTKDSTAAAKDSPKVAKSKPTGKAPPPTTPAPAPGVTAAPVTSAPTTTAPAAAPTVTAARSSSGSNPATSGVGVSSPATERRKWENMKQNFMSVSRARVPTLRDNVIRDLRAYRS